MVVTSFVIKNLIYAPEHLETISSWHHAEWSKLYPGQTLDDRREKMQGFLTEKFIPSTFVAMINKTVVGSAAIIENDMETKPELKPWLASVYVDKSYRRQGIGAKLVRHVMDAAKENKVESLYLFTELSEKFYKNLGWHVMSKEEYAGEYVSVMKVRL